MVTVTTYTTNNTHAADTCQGEICAMSKLSALGDRSKDLRVVVGLNQTDFAFKIGQSIYSFVVNYQELKKNI